MYRIYYQFMFLMLLRNAHYIYIYLINPTSSFISKGMKKCDNSYAKYQLIPNCFFYYNNPDRG